MNFIWCKVCTRNEEGIKKHQVAREHEDVGHFEYKSMQLRLFNSLMSSHTQIKLCVCLTTRILVSILRSLQPRLGTIVLWALKEILKVSIVVGKWELKYMWFPLFLSS